MTKDSAETGAADYTWLAADMQEFIVQTLAAYPADAVEASIAQQRDYYDQMCERFDRPHPAAMVTQDETIAGVPCRRYQPAKREGTTTAIYFHGGGFIVGGLHSHDAICAELADQAGVELIAVDYRLVPEHKHPAAYQDARAVVAAVPGPKVVLGDSAGGNLAAALCATLDRDLHEIMGQVLIYPGLGGDMTLPSYSRHAHAPLLTRAEVEYYTAMRFDGAVPSGDMSAAPLHADSYEGLPPTAIFTAECDPLASDGVEYAARIADAGGQVSLIQEPGMVHGYLRARHSVAGARASFERIATALSQLAKGGGIADQ